MKTIVYAILTLVAIAGSTTVQAQENPALRLGLSHEEVSSHFEGTGTHQFTALHDTNTFLCVSYSFGKPFIRYYFLFKNDELVSILDTQPFFANAFELKPHPTPRNPNAKVEVRKPWQAHSFMTNIIGTASLSPDKFSTQLATQLQKVKEKKPDYNVLPAFAILAPLIVPDMIVQNAKQKAWMREYDPFKIALGTRRAKVETVYGKPQFIVRHDDSGRETHAYGPLELLWRDKTQISLGPLNKRFWVAVVYDDDVVVQIFSNDLFNDTTIVTHNNEAKETQNGEQEN